MFRGRQAPQERRHPGTPTPWDLTFHANNTMQSPPPIRPVLSHMGIYVHDMDAMEDFYTRVMGLVVTDRGKAFRFPIDLVFLSSRPGMHHQLALASGRPEDETYSVVNQMSFAVASLDELREMLRRVTAEAVRDLVQINHGNAWSLYFLDPEGNRVEVMEAETPLGEMAGGAGEVVGRKGGTGALTRGGIPRGGTDVAGLTRDESERASGDRGADGASGGSGLVFVGHKAARRGVSGREDRPPTAEELDAMRAFVRKGMEEGAYGLSAGLFYLPGNYAEPPEVI